MNLPLKNRGAQVLRRTCFSPRELLGVTWMFADTGYNQRYESYQLCN